MKDFVVAILVMLVLANSVDSQSLYACWGGCYNQCILGNAIAKSQKLHCDYQCLNTCIPHTASEYHYYCQLGCSLKRCIPLSNDGARMEKCFGWCSNLCNGNVAP